MWYYVKDGKKIGPLPDEDVHNYYIKGEIQNGTKVWMSGQKDWQTLKTSPLHFKISAKRFSESNRRITLALTLFRPMLVIFAVANMLNVVFKLAIVKHIDKIIDGGFVTPLQKEIAANVLVDINKLIFFILAVILMAVLKTGFDWVYSAATNARSMKRYFRTSPSFSAWSFLIPFVNIIAPVKVVSGIYRAAAEANRMKLSCYGYALIINWWFATLFALCVVLFNNCIANKLVGDIFKMRIYFSCYSSVCVTAACIAWIILISVISNRQKKFFLSDNIIPSSLASVRENF